MRKAASYIFSGQFTKLLVAIGERLPSWLFRRNAARLFEMHNLSDDMGAEATAMECGDYRVREASREDLPGCAALVDLTVAEYVRRYDHGDRCVTVFAGQRPVHVTWLHFGPCYVRGLSLLLQFNETDCYIYGAFTDPEHRRKGLYEHVQRKVLQTLAARGTKRAIQVVVEGNQVPVVMFQKLGYQLTGTVYHVTVCGIRKTIITDPSSRGKNVRQLRWRRPAGVFWI